MLATAEHSSTPRTGHRPRAAEAQVGEQPRFFSATFGLGLLGAVLLWAAFPPLNFPWLAWIAPAPWLWLARHPQLPGRRPYLALWLAGCLHWLLMLEGIRLAHPALYAGWIALSFYLAAYFPVFVGLTRVAVQRLKMPLTLAAPILWVGLELIRGHFLTGFSMALLAHSQAEFPWLIQVSDLAGGYVLSFVIVLVAACIARLIPLGNLARETRPLSPNVWWPILPAAAAIALTLTYGWWRLREPLPGVAGSLAQVALIQGSLDTEFVPMTEERREKTYEHHRALTRQATSTHPNLDLVIWPESMFVDAEQLAGSPPPAEELRRQLLGYTEDFHALMASESSQVNINTAQDHSGTKLLVGTTTIVYGSSTRRIYNAALLADRTGNIVGRYYKMHPVMFGEYIPFGDAIPLLYRITPMSGGLSVGDGPKVFEVAGLKMSPSICFESTVPHLIRRQLRQLGREGTPADVLVNVTNDGWFWGTAMLDLHFRCGIFRAVENRKPLIVAANTGISTWVDGRGLIRARGPRRQPQVLIAEVQADGRVSPYSRLGDWPAWPCAAFCICLAAVGLRRRPS